MNKISQHMEEQLLDYLDGLLPSTERQSLEAQLRQNDALRSRLEELKSVHFLLKDLKIEQPSKNFSSLVMNGLDQTPEVKTLPLRSSLMLLAGILIVIGIASLLVSTGVFDGATTIVDLKTFKLPKDYVKLDLPAFAIDGKLIVNTIIFLNVALALVVLDRVILKPIFKRRMGV
jgi:anti-sigma factor RsiW